MRGTSRASFDGWMAPWGTVAAILIVGTMLCAVVEAFALDALVERPTVQGGSITTLLPATAYASATVMKVCLVGGLLAGVIALVGWAARLGRATSLSRRPRWAMVSVVLPPLTLIFATVAVLTVQTFVDLSPGSPADFQRFGRVGVYAMAGGLVAGAVLAMVACWRREQPRTLALFGGIVNLVLLGLFSFLRFYAQHFDQDGWASALSR